MFVYSLFAVCATWQRQAHSCTLATVSHMQQGIHGYHYMSYSCCASKPMLISCKQVVTVFEDALKVHPTGRMYSLFSEYLQDCLSQQSAPPQPQDDQLSPEQQATAEQLLRLYKRASEAGEQRLHQQPPAWHPAKMVYVDALVTELALACTHL